MECVAHLIDIPKPVVFAAMRHVAVARAGVWLTLLAGLRFDGAVAVVVETVALFRFGQYLSNTGCPRSTVDACAFALLACANAKRARCAAVTGLFFTGCTRARAIGHGVVFAAVGGIEVTVNIRSHARSKRTHARLAGRYGIWKCWTSVVTKAAILQVIREVKTELTTTTEAGLTRLNARTTGNARFTHTDGTHWTIGIDQTAHAGVFVGIANGIHVAIRVVGAPHLTLIGWFAVLARRANVFFRRAGYTIARC